MSRSLRVPTSRRSPLPATTATQPSRKLQACMHDQPGATSESRFPANIGPRGPAPTTHVVTSDHRPRSPTAEFPERDLRKLLCHSSVARAAETHPAILTLTSTTATHPAATAADALWKRLPCVISLRVPHERHQYCIPASTLMPTCAGWFTLPTSEQTVAPCQSPSGCAGGAPRLHVCLIWQLARGTGFATEGLNG